HFEEKPVHLFSSFAVDGTVHANHSAEGRDGIAFESSLVGLGERLAGSGTGGIGVFDDGADRAVVGIEFLSKVPGGLQVDDVVVGKLFALNLACVGYAYA